MLISAHSAPCSRLRSLHAAGSPLGVPSSALQLGGQTLVRRPVRQRTAQLGRSSLGVGGYCGACGRRPRSLHAAGSPLGVPSSTLQRGGQAVAHCGRWRCYYRRCSGATRPWRPTAAHSGPPDSGGAPLGGEAKCRAAGLRPCSLHAAGSPIGVPCSVLQRGGQAVERYGRRRCCYRRCSGATRHLLTSAARSGPADLGDAPLRGKAKCGAFGRRPCSSPAAGSSLGVPSSALQRGGTASARGRRPQRTPRLVGGSARQRGNVWRFRPAPLLFARSRFPAGGSELGAAAGR